MPRRFENGRAYIMSAPWDAFDYQVLAIDIGILLVAIAPWWLLGGRRKTVKTADDSGRSL